MFIILLRFSANRDQVSEHVDAHRDWLKQGFDDGVFLLAGTLKQDMGGGILAKAESRSEIEARVARDPFVEHDVVRAEVLEMDPAHADDRLSFLLE